MQNFFILEGGYLAIALFVLIITIFVTTRPFISKGAAKKWVFLVFLLLALFIGAHYMITTSRMQNVKEAFEQDKTILCESRAQRKVAQSIEIKKSREWTLKDGLFTSPNYSRGFLSARCIVK